MIRVLLYGDVDLNLIDGSAVWLASLAEVLGGMPDVSVTVLQKTPLMRTTVIQSAASLANVTFLDPWKLAEVDSRFHGFLSSSKGQRLAPGTAAALIAQLDRDYAFDVLLIRSIEAVCLLFEIPGLAQRTWVYITDPMRCMPLGGHASLEMIATHCGRVLCQTEEAANELCRLLEFSVADKLLLLPPMIPALAVAMRSPLDPVAPRIGYSGKFSPSYMIIEMLDAFEEIRRRMPGAEFHVVGDKFHNVPPEKDFSEIVTKRLKATPGVVWHGGVSRSENNEILGRVNLASSWRDATFDDSVEFSTKVLEYSALGIPVLMNPTSIQRRVFGADYPGYVTNEAEFIDRVVRFTQSPALYSATSCAVHKIAAEFTFENQRQRLMPILSKAPRVRHTSVRKPTILWVGHDFRFLHRIKHTLDLAGNYHALVDEYQGHVIQQPARSQKLLAKADLIFCEWCLGNAEWYSKNKQPHQRLVVRLHHQELQLSFLDRIHWDNVDRIIFICPANMELFLIRFPSLVAKADVIYNAVDYGAFGLPKLEGAGFNLGVLGIAPKRKAPHIAIELLTELKQLDSRYVLFIKSHHPSAYSWLWRQSDEREYYEMLYATIERSRHANSIVFDPPGNDVGEWFTKIGFILSPSDHEGSHQAVAEGMASGAVPVIRDWFGSALLYPDKYIFSSVSKAVGLVSKWNTRENYEREAAFCREFARRFELSSIVDRFSKVFADLLSSRGTRATGRSQAGPAKHSAFSD